MIKSKKLILNIMDSLVPRERITSYEARLQEAQTRLWSAEEAFTGWVKLPLEYDSKEILRIKETAAKIRKQCDAFVVIGIGGSYLGARAAIEMLSVQSTVSAVFPKIYFAGQNLSGTYHKELIEEIKDKDICLCVITKSGTTTETSAAFALLKDLLISKYGREEAQQRIYTITDKEKGTLRQETERERYESFIIPADIGGRYSVLTPAGLLPIAVAGIDIEEMLAGAAHEARDANINYGLLEHQKEKPDVFDRSAVYAVVRNELFARGKVIEIFECYEPKLRFFAEWLKQLFGESEGKDGKGIFPAALQFSTDLHSMEQFLQQGSQVFFETVLNVTEQEKDIIIPDCAGEDLAGRSMNSVNRAALEGVTAAHRSAGIPVIRLDIPELSAYCFGQLVYFFERACALSGFLSGVNPFNQPGVEKYKSEMRKALTK